MDLADAALIRICARKVFAKIFTVVKKDFSVYRFMGRIVPQSLGIRTLLQITITTFTSPPLEAGYGQNPQR